MATFTDQALIFLPTAALFTRVGQLRKQDLFVKRICSACASWERGIIRLNNCLLIYTKSHSIVYLIPLGN